MHHVLVMWHRTRKKEYLVRIATTVNGEFCVTLYEDIPLTSTVSTCTTGCCDNCCHCGYCCTSSALLAKPLADLLLKVFKPAIKKVITKISKTQGEEGKDRVPKGAPRSSARTLTGDTDFAEDEGREIE